ncbi:hypothetical protein AKJ16_DCAP15121 [Drosera capensis]
MVLSYQRCSSDQLVTAETCVTMGLALSKLAPLRSLMTMTHVFCFLRTILASLLMSASYLFDLSPWWPVSVNLNNAASTTFSIEHIRTDQMFADPLSKGLSAKAFLKHVQHIGLIT